MFKNIDKKESSRMQNSTHGSYHIEQQNNILVIDAQGPFDDVVSEQYQKDIKKITKKMCKNPWASLISFKGNAVFTPDAEQGLIETTQYRVDNGMVAVAAVILDSAYADTLQMQLQRIYQSSSVQFNFFSDTKNAQRWLESFIN